MKKVFKNIGIVLGCLLLVLCVGVNIWYFYILKFGPDKVVSITHEVGLQKLENSDDEKYFIELNYFSNEENNGLEMFEIKFNYMLDENQEQFYSQGLQFVAEGTDNIKYDYFIDETNHALVNHYDFSLFYPAKNYYTQWGGYRPSENVGYYNYASADDYEHATLSTNPISSLSKFKIQVGDDLFLMEFKNYKTEATSNNYMYRYQGDTQIYIYYNLESYYDCYAYYDYNYFCKLMYEAVQTISSGTNSAMVFEFGDLFTYSKYNAETGQYDTELTPEETVKLTADIKSYYAIKVNKSSSGVRQASESLFGAVNGSTTYNTNSVISDDYFVGRSILCVDEEDFNLVKIEEGYCVLKLKEEFIKAYEKYNNIILKVDVNLDYFTKQGITILGFATDNGLDNFEVEHCYFYEIINGEIIQTEVLYV